MVAGSFIGQKVIVNEFVAYMNFGVYLRPDDDVVAEGLQVLSQHTKAIISFALCGFATCLPWRSCWAAWHPTVVMTLPASV